MTRLFMVLLLVAPSLNAAEPAVQIVAHRGASHDAPENTVAAIKLAWEQKADASELDIYLTKDQKIVVIHDKDTKRTTGVEGKVVDRLFSDLRKLDAGSWKSPKFAGERLPTLDEMLANVPSGKRLFIEVKCGPEIVPELNRTLMASQLKPSQTPVIAFSPDVIAAVKKARPDLPAYWLVSLKPKKGEKPPVAEDILAKAKAIKADGLDLSADDSLDAALAAKIKAAGLRLDVWTVDDPIVAKRMVAIGVDGITTNRPAWLREQLAK
ncbi:MAG: glycerophosphodiester phosphodiesterase [Gemmataceae bacterium]